MITGSVIIVKARPLTLWKGVACLLIKEDTEKMSWKRKMKIKFRNLALGSHYTRHKHCLLLLHAIYTFYLWILLYFLRGWIVNRERPEVKKLFNCHTTVNAKIIFFSIFYFIQKNTSSFFSESKCWNKKEAESCLLQVCNDTLRRKSSKSNFWS